jgi:hypothetical protein
MRRRKHTQPALPAVDYAPGHFTELVRAHGWPPRYEPQIDWRSKHAQTSTASRDRALAEGKWWASGTLGGLSAKSDAQLLTRTALQVAALGGGR